MAKQKKQPEKIDIGPVVEAACKDPKTLSSVVEELGGASRLHRQTASSILLEVSKRDITLLDDYVGDIIDALSRPEAQTRWRVLQILTIMLPEKSRKCAKAIEQVEDSLFDETMGSLRLSAFVFLCKYGKSTQARSVEVWPLIADAISCYHGDVEFDDMLDALLDFSKGKLDADVKAGLAEELQFDAENATGHLKSASLEIIKNASPKRSANNKDK